jgi:hypothetical protein
MCYGASKQQKIRQREYRPALMFPVASKEFNSLSAVYFRELLRHELPTPISVKWRVRSGHIRRE